MTSKLKVFIVFLIIFSINVNISFSYSNEFEYVKESYNLLLIGNDSTDNYKYIMILNVNPTNKSLSLLSIPNMSNKKSMDTFSYYSSNDEEKLLRSIYSNFNIKVDGYVIINRLALKKIIDSIGGIQVDNNIVDGEEVLAILDTSNFNSYDNLRLYQENIIQEIIYSLSRTSFYEFPRVIKDTFPYVSLDISPFKMLSLGFTALSFNNYKASRYTLY